MIRKPSKGGKTALFALREFLPHEGFGAWFMGSPAKDKAERWVDGGDGPAGQDIGEAGDIRLRITCRGSERMQFQDFPREVFIEATRARAGGAAIGPD